ncbi:MAG: hypothetical protein ACXWJW_04940 [Xanthobacteraceae bacterium]
MEKQEVRMKSPFKNFKGFALALLLGTTAIASTLVPVVAHADDDSEWVEVNHGADSNGNEVVAYRNKNDPSLALRWYFWADGTSEKIISKEGADPGPDDNGKGTGKPDIAQLIKDGVITYAVKKNPEQTQLGKLITENGDGFAPHGNPGDQDNNNGPSGAPHRDTSTSLTAKEKTSLIKTINTIAKDQHITGTSMLGEEGGSENAPGFENHGSGKNTSSNTRSNSDNRNHTIGKTMSLGPKPEVVNPPLKAGLLEDDHSASAVNVSVTGKTTGQGAAGIH